MEFIDIFRHSGESRNLVSCLKTCVLGYSPYHVRGQKPSSLHPWTPAYAGVTSRPPLLLPPLTWSVRFGCYLYASLISCWILVALAHENQFANDVTDSYKRDRHEASFIANGLVSQRSIFPSSCCRSKMRCTLVQSIFSFSAAVRSAPHTLDSCDVNDRPEASLP